MLTKRDLSFDMLAFFQGLDDAMNGGTGSVDEALAESRRKIQAYRDIQQESDGATGDGSVNDKC